MEAQEEALLTKVTLPAGPTPPVARAVESYHAGFDHYFTTADPTEIAALDAGPLHGWLRTGLAFNVVVSSVDTGGMAFPVCRYYGNPAYGPDTHFYSASAAECAAVHANWPEQWLPESGNVFQVYLPDLSSGACSAGTLAVYRTWNQRTATNHRYTMDRGVQSMMMGKGNIAEGFGNPPVAMCSPN